jgi:hypothetical protein
VSYEPAENAYYCPEGKALRYRGLQRTNQGATAIAPRERGAEAVHRKSLRACSLSQVLRAVYWHEPARQAVRALARTLAYERLVRYNIEALFAELKQSMRIGRVRLRRP